MPRVIARRLAAAALLGATLVLLAATATAAATPVGPRLSFVEWRLKKPMILRLATVAPDGSEQQVLTGRSEAKRARGIGLFTPLLAKLMKRSG